MKMEENIKYKNMIELIYQAEQKVLDEKIKQANKKIRDKIKDINLEKIIKENPNQQEIEKLLETIEENYSIKIAQYNQEFYQQGFIDGVNLMLNCIKM